MARRWPSGSARCAPSRAPTGRRTSGSPPKRCCAPRTAPAWCSTTSPAAPRASALLMNMFAGTRRNMTLGFPDHLTKWELSDAYREAYLKEQQDRPARDRRRRPGVRERHDGRRRRRHQIPRADLAREGRRPLHRHRHLQHHPRSGGELAQRRRLPRAGARQEDRRHADGGRPSRRASIATSTSSAASRCRSRWCSAAIRSRFFFGGLEAPYGVFELDVVGGLRGRPMKMVRGKVTGLPFPANAEIVLEGYRPARPHARGRPVRRMDRPLRRRRARDLPVLDIKAIYHRNDPILLGVPPMGGGPDEMARYRAVMRSATIKQNIDQRRRAGRAAGLVPRDRRRAHVARRRRSSSAIPGTRCRPAISPRNAAPRPMRRNTSWWWTTTST